MLNLPRIGYWVRLCMVLYRLLYPSILVFCAILIVAAADVVAAVIPAVRAKRETASQAQENES